MSGARGPTPARSPPTMLPGGAIAVAPCMLAPSSTSTPGVVGLPRAPNRWPTTSAVSDTSASAATAQGNALANPRERADDGAPAGVPHRWQKRAPGVSAAEQVAQMAPARAVPQLEQKRPVAGAPHAGQRDVLVPSGVGAIGEAGGVVIAGKLHRGDTPWQRSARRVRSAARSDGSVYGSGLMTAAGLRDLLDRLLRLLVLAGEPDDVGLRDDAHERATL